ncbi:hypothetical protein BJV82DRAFT_388929 [Fennellomyces sp. T-0311]|nr:hypothetical protein BJV82DRAFT_388929 [Fennellomyces sp. T-0311]
MSNQEAPVIPSSNSLQHHQRPPRYSPPFGNSILERSDPPSSSTHSVSPTTNGSVNSANGHYSGQSSVVHGNVAGLMSNGTAQRLSEEAGKKHLPLRKRIGSLPKKKAWIPPPVPPPSSQPQATTERRVSYPPTPTSSHDIKTADYYSASPYSDGGDTTETDEEKAADFKEKKPPDRKQTVIIHPEPKERRISMPLLSQPAVIPKSTTPGSTTAPSATSTSTTTVTKMKPLKKVQHWIIKGKMNGAAAVPPKNGLVT